MSTKKRKRGGKPKRRRRVGAGAHPTQIRQMERRAADAFYEDDDADQARELFAQAEALGPLSDDGLDTYLDVLHTLRDLDHYARIALTMVDRHPGDPDAKHLGRIGLLRDGSAGCRDLLLGEVDSDRTGAPRCRRGS